MSDTTLRRQRATTQGRPNKYFSDFQYTMYEVMLLLFLRNVSRNETLPIQQPYQAGKILY
ncbi:hypothetical protein [Haliscomenobacter hydrossis]|uniref:hypothetical protein n=1 Tax=Haliscomenobacter hydrossis TaxID=2350 RepID=UPI0002E84A07|nr:hypothetical protein [Haliscomenobacter hydrossis]